MSDDFIDEELQIMNERENEERSINVASFQLPLTELNPPKIKTIDVSTTIGDAVKTMQDNRFGSLVITKDDEIAGILTERDVLMKVVGKADLKKDTVEKFMTEDPISLMPTDMIAHVMQNMHVGGFRHVPIVDESGAVQSMVSIKDVLTFVIDRFPQEIINVVSVPYRGKVQRDGA
jgi:CBS domain-containing protein